MARYQILYWQHIPLGVKAYDINGTVRENLPSRFQTAFEKAAARGRQTGTTTSGFKWSKEQVREGTAAEVVAAIAKELDETWNEAEALALFEGQQP